MKFSKWISSHIWKCITNIILLISVGSLLALVEYGVISSPIIGFTCEDPVISHKYTGEVITPEILGATTVLLPASIVICSEILRHKNFKNIDLYLSGIYLKQLAIGVIFTLALTEVGKTIVAEHRPHFFDVCEPDTAKNCTPGTWIETFKCTSTKYTGYFVVDSSKSFPSGHSSISAFTGLFSAVSFTKTYAYVWSAITTQLIISFLNTLV